MLSVVMLIINIVSVDGNIIAAMLSVIMPNAAVLIVVAPPWEFKSVPILLFGTMLHNFFTLIYHFKIS